MVGEAGSVSTPASRAKVDSPLSGSTCSGRVNSGEVMMETYSQPGLWAEFPVASTPAIRIDRARTKTKELFSGFSLPLWPEDTGKDDTCSTFKTVNTSGAAIESLEFILESPIGNPDSSDSTSETRSTVGIQQAEISLASVTEIYASQRSDIAFSSNDSKPSPKPLARHNRNSTANSIEPMRKASAETSLQPEGAMESVAELVQELMERGGAASERVRSFIGTFPPTEQWGEPWPPSAQEFTASLGTFAPSASGYSSGLSDVLAGCRRVRFRGIWESGYSGHVVLVRGLATSDWQLIGANTD